MRKCAFCGTDNTDGEVFCGLCGQRLDTIPYELNDDKPAEVSEKTVEECSPKIIPAQKSTFCPLCCGSGEIEHVYRANTVFEDQKHSNKMREMISALSDDEITIQIENITKWAEGYKKLLADELLQRGHKVLDVQDESDSPYDEYADDADEFYMDENALSSESVADETIDYNLTQMIQQKVAAFSVEETKEALQKLRGVPKYILSAEELTQLHYEIDTCELHLFELIGDVNE